MRVLLIFILLVNLSSIAVWAKTYSCCDNTGQLHFSDNLQGLPEECLGKEEVVKSKQPDNLQYVPVVPIPKDVNLKFQQNVKDVENMQARKKSVATRLQVKASALQERYRQLRDEMSRARRIWDNTSRQLLKQLKQDLAGIRAEKQTLLAELKSERLATKERQAVEEALAEISDE